MKKKAAYLYPKPKTTRNKAWSIFPVNFLLAGTQANVVALRKKCLPVVKQQPLIKRLKLMAINGLKIQRSSAQPCMMETMFETIIHLDLPFNQRMFVPKFEFLELRNICMIPPYRPTHSAKLLIHSCHVELLSVSNFTFNYS